MTELYIDPPSHHFLRDQLFALSQGRYHSSLASACGQLRDTLGARGVPVRTADYIPAEPDATTKIYISLGRLNQYRRLGRRPDVVLSAYLAMEAPIVDPAMFRELPRAQRYFKRVYCYSDSESLQPFVTAPLRLQPMVWPQAFDRVDAALWSRTDRKFLVLMNTNKRPRLFWQELYTARLEALEFFSRTDEIDLYGPGWDVPSYQMGIGWMPGTLQHGYRTVLAQWQRLRPNPLLTAARRVSRGVAEDKYGTLAQYDFCICFENMILKGWITEKIFDCFYAGTVPVYWGAPDITDYIPAECFIDMRQFGSYSALRDYLKSVSPAEIRRYKECARDFLGSPRFQQFSTDAFVEILAGVVEQDAAVASSAERESAGARA